MDGPVKVIASMSLKRDLLPWMLAVVAIGGVGLDDAVPQEC
jgi:hypothetical protein